MPLGRKVFVAVVLSQLITIALILGWYFYTLRSELGSLTKQRAQEAVLQSIAATEDYFKPAEMVVEAGALMHASEKTYFAKVCGARRQNFARIVERGAWSSKKRPRWGFVSSWRRSSNVRMG